MLKPKPEERLRLDEIMVHPWMQAERPPNAPPYRSVSQVIQAGVLLRAQSVLCPLRAQAYERKRIGALSCQDEATVPTEENHSITPVLWTQNPLQLATYVEPNEKNNNKPVVESNVGKNDNIKYTGKRKSKNSNDDSSNSRRSSLIPQQIIPLDYVDVKKGVVSDQSSRISATRALSVDVNMSPEFYCQLHCDIMEKFRNCLASFASVWLKSTTTHQTTAPRYLTELNNASEMFLTSITYSVGTFQHFIYIMQSCSELIDVLISTYNNHSTKLIGPATMRKLEANIDQVKLIIQSSVQLYEDVKRTIKNLVDVYSNQDAFEGYQESNIVEQPTFVSHY